MKQHRCHKCKRVISIRHFFCQWCGTSQTIAESRPTVRAKCPVQQRKGDKPIQFVTDGADSYPMSCTPLSVMGMGGSSSFA